MFGVPCPGCGSTRAVFALLRGDFHEAIVWHPLILLSLASILYIAVRNTLFKNKPIKNVEIGVFIVISFLYIAVFIWRMILFFPHTPPMTMHDGALHNQLFRFFRSAMNMYGNKFFT
ncbi:MAG: DUF2752 domain-containing protein [Defluviitaleaceae bacterium]|nr:DUF2752 domain-containing protein [Defluviitaleaceae bacterium]